MAATGARFSQVARVKVSDVQTAQKRVLIPSSAKGGSTKVRQAIAVPLGDDVLARLDHCLRGRAGHEPLLLRPRGGPWQFASEMTCR